jgi:hypothetical protein
MRALPLLRRTVTHCNAAGAALATIVLTATVLSVIVSASTATVFLRRASDGLEAAFGAALALDVREQMRSRHVVIVDTSPVQDFVSTVLQRLVLEYAAKDGVTLDAATQKANNAVNMYLFEQLRPSFLLFLALSVFGIFVGATVRTTVGVLAGDARRSAWECLRRAVPSVLRVLLLSIMTGVCIGLIVLPMAILVSLSSSVIVLALGVALIVAAVAVILVRLMFALPYVVQDGCGVIEGMRRSWRLVQGRTMAVLFTTFQAGGIVLFVVLLAEFGIAFLTATALRYSPWGAVIAIAGTALNITATSVFTVLRFEYRRMLER